MAEEWQAMRRIAKDRHDERVKKTPEHIKYCQQRFKILDIPAKCVNAETGQFNIRIGDRTLVYYCSTGTIMINSVRQRERGLTSAIRLYRQMAKVER